MAGGDKMVSCHEPSFSLQLKAIVATYMLFAILISATIIPIYGIFCYPYIFGPYIVLPYMMYNYFHRHELRDGNKWRFFSENFPYITIIRSHIGLNISKLPKELAEAEMKEDAQFVIACFPHGTASDFRILMEGMLPQVFPNIHGRCRTLAASVLFYIPLVREISLWTGCIDARRKVAEKAMDKGRTIIVLPGGEAEQIRTVKGKEKVYIKNRKGFVKLAMRKNVPVVPVYVFGCSDLYETSNAFYNFRYWLMKNFGVCLTMHSGMFKGACPFPVKNTIVMGNPLDFKMKGKEPTTEELDLAHEQFCKALETLFNENKERLGYDDRILEIE